MAAEAFGTFCLVFGGTGAVAVGSVSGDPLGAGGVAAAFGLVVAVMVFAVGHISGAHLNPAVTLGFVVGRHFPLRDVAPYLAAQIGGAIGASFALRGLLGSQAALGVTQPQLVGKGAAFLVEAGLTTVLMIVILAVATDDRAVGQLAALAIGGTIALEALVMGPVTGASMNPARSLGPAIAAADGADLWLYLVGPPVGALLGALLYGWLRTLPPEGAEATRRS